MEPIISGSNNNLILKDSGQITGSNVKFDGGTIGGFVITDSKIETSDFVSGLKGVRISTEQNGLIEAENARIRGTLATTTFEKESVNAVGGQLRKKCYDDYRFIYGTQRYISKCCKCKWIYSR